MKLELLECQIYPVKNRNEKENYVITSKKELLKQLKSLKEDAFMNAHNAFREPVFYKDYNALKIAIKILEKAVEEND